MLREFTEKPRGFVLVTGPTGSGKSTTLAAMLDLINEQRHEHIMTIEDPIEFLHKHKSCIVNQRELGADAQSFALALKAALRQDPDVILVGEMRDLETISTALTAAETGHLVFATLHTQDTAQTVDRVVDVFPPSQQQQVRVQLSVALQGIVSQQLLPTSDGLSRVCATEVLVPTPAVRNLIREGKTHQIYSALQTGGTHGMQTMDASLADLVRRNKITQSLAESRSSSPEELRRLMGAPSGRRKPMAQYAFKALDLAGIPTTGEVEADDKQMVASQLSSKGLIVIDIVEEKPTDVGDIFARFKKVKADELTIATRQLSTMVSSGMSLLRALYVIEEQTENDVLKDAFVEVRKDVEAGMSLSEGLKRHPKIFNELYVAMVAAGETGGILDSTLIRVADQLEKDDALRRQVKAAMVYPSPDRRLRPHRPDGARGLPRAGVREGLQGLRRRAARHHQVHGDAVAPDDRLVVHHDRRRLGLIYAFRKWKNSEQRPHPVGPLQAQGAR